MDFNRGTFDSPLEEFELYQQNDTSGVKLSSFYAAKKEGYLEKLKSTRSFSKFSVAVSGYFKIFLFDDGIKLFFLETEILNVEDNLSFEDFDGTYCQLTTESIQLIGDIYFREKIKVGWTHKVFISHGEDKKKLSWLSAIPEQEEDRFGNNYGWGCSDIVEAGGLCPSILMGCIASQYFYFALDRYNRQLPSLIRSIRQNSNRKPTSELQRDATQIRHKVKSTQIEYNDIINSVAGRFSAPLYAYHQSWRFERLSMNLNEKIPLLQNTIHELEAKSQARSSAAIELMLFAVSSFSLVSLFIATHDYALKPVTQKISTELVINAMQPVNPKDILSFSILLSLISLTIYIILKYRITSKLKSVFANLIDRTGRN
jgi:hypothetical protein